MRNLSHYLRHLLYGTPLSRRMCHCRSHYRRTGWHVPDCPKDRETRWGRYRAARYGDIGPGGAGCQRWVSLLYALGTDTDTTRKRRG